jgi:hypothetical protein
MGVVPKNSLSLWKSRGTHALVSIAVLHFAGKIHQIILE